MRELSTGFCHHARPPASADENLKLDLAFSAEEIAFREEVRAFLEASLPRDMVERARQSFMYVSKDDTAAWHRTLYEKGWVAPNWPLEQGGPGWSAAQRFIFEEECAFAGCPRLSPFGLTMVGPVIYTYGSEAQKARYLPRILSGEETWCQGYSEPGAGSDLAALGTKAVRDGDAYIVDGQKTWTSGAHKADWMFCLARTRSEGKPQAGITFLLIDMRSRGITIEPIVSMDRGHYLNNVFLDNVRVPIEQRIGEENEGWTYAKFLLSNERTGIAGVGRSKQRLEQVKAMAREAPAYGETLLSDPGFSRQLAEVEIALQALEVTNLRSFAQDAADPTAVNPASSILKIKGTEVAQTINELMVDVLGYYALPYDGPTSNPWRNEPTLGPAHADGVMGEHLIRRSASIFGGTNEIQKNIIAKIVLGL